MAKLRIPTIIVVSAVLVGPGCAIRFQGELDGEPLPTFSTAAFAVIDGGGTAASVVALATPGDSCAEASAYTELRIDKAQATTPERQDQVADALQAWEKRVLPEGAWIVQLQVDTAGRALLRDVSVDLSGTDNDANVALVLCRSEGNPLSADGVFVPDVDCSRATEGTLALALDEEAGTFRLQASDEPVTFTDSVGRADGALRLDMTFSTCPSFGAGLEQLGGSFIDGGGPIGEGEGEGEVCREQCFTDETGQTRCEVFCEG
jgi:hypothetical protein